MTFEEWNRANNWDGLNARGAWNAALQEASWKVSRCHRDSSEQDTIDRAVDAIESLLSK